ncbi:MAG: hypothetical protein U0746_11430 [Gemmataceae bacterium]
MSRWLCIATALALAGAAHADDVTIDGLKSKTPDSWKKAETTSNMQHAAFDLPKADGDKDATKLVVYFFGPGGGGGIDANLTRWKGQFKNPEEKNVKKEEMKVKDVKATYYDITGTYLEKNPPFAPNAKITEKPDYRALNVIFESPKGPYFFRVIGPAKSVEKNKKEFDEWLKNFK